MVLNKYSRMSLKLIYEMYCSDEHLQVSITILKLFLYDVTNKLKL